MIGIGQSLPSQRSHKVCELLALLGVQQLVSLHVTAQNLDRSQRHFWSAMKYTVHLLPKGFGFMQAKPTSSFSSVAVTLDELGEIWDGEKLHLELVSEINGKRMGQPNTGKDMFFTYPDLIAHACRTRALSAGTIIGAGSVTNQDEQSGFGCIAEARIHEQMTNGNPSTPFLKNGDEVYIDSFDAQGKTIFGAIRQKIKTL